MEIEANPDGTYTVSISHCVVVSKENAFFNFRQYVEDLIKQFDAKMSTTLYAIILENK